MTDNPKKFALYEKHTTELSVSEKKGLSSFFIWFVYLEKYWNFQPVFLIATGFYSIWWYTPLFIKKVFFDLKSLAVSNLNLFIFLSFLLVIYRRIPDEEKPLVLSLSWGPSRDGTSTFALKENEDGKVMVGCFSSFLKTWYQL